MKVTDITSLLIEAIQEIRFAGWLIRISDEEKNGKYDAIAFLTVKNKVVDQIKISGDSYESVLADAKTQIKSKSTTVAKDTRKNAKYKTVQRNYDIYAGMTIDFNKFASDLIGLEPTAGRLINDGEEVHFDLMHPEIYKQFDGDVASLGFKKIKNRNVKGAPEAYLGMNTSPKVIHVLGLELGGRYMLDEIISDNEEFYQRFTLTLHSIQQANKEKIHINDPAFTIAVTPGDKRRIQ